VHPSSLFEHDLGGVGGIGIGIQGASIFPRHRRFIPAARALVDEEVREAGHLLSKRNE
jgi:hypothetical protein